MTYNSPPQIPHLYRVSLPPRQGETHFRTGARWRFICAAQYKMTSKITDQIANERKPQALAAFFEWFGWPAARIQYFNDDLTVFFAASYGDVSARCARDAVLDGVGNHFVEHQRQDCHGARR